MYHCIFHLWASSSLQKYYWTFLACGIKKIPSTSPVVVHWFEAAAQKTCHGGGGGGVDPTIKVINIWKRTKSLESFSWFPFLLNMWCHAFESLMYDEEWIKLADTHADADSRSFLCPFLPQLVPLSRKLNIFHSWLCTRRVSVYHYLKYA